VLLSDASAFDLDAYLARIGYNGPRTATMDVLRELHLRHPQAIAFENLNPLLGWPVALDTVSLQRKLVHDGRGGYCFEQNLLFAHGLTAMGFRVTGLAARVTYNAPVGSITPRGHMLLRIELDGEVLIADVGFGGLTMTGPLVLKTDVEQATPHEPFQLIGDGEAFVVQARIQDRWVSLYRFGLEPQYLVDYELTSWYLSHHPASFFITTLIAARPDTDRRYALRNNLFSTYFSDGRSEQRALAVSELRLVLGTAFGLRLPDSPELTAALARAAMPAPAGRT
jgi:N-hydroxyarylamine O-acetyltransferase